MSNQFTQGDTLYETDDPDAFALFISRASYGLPRLVLEHLTQSVRSGQVTYLDMGPELNLAEYGTELPPRIPFENVNVPVGMFYGTRDVTADPEDADWFADQMGDNLVTYNMYPLAHFSFTLARDPTVYLDDILDLYSNYPIDPPQTSQ